MTIRAVARCSKPTQSAAFDSRKEFVLIYYAIKNIGSDIWSLHLPGKKECSVLHSFLLSQYEKRFLEGADDLERALGVGYMSFDSVSLGDFLGNLNFHHVNSAAGLLESFPNTHVPVKPEWKEWHIWGVKECTCEMCGKHFPGVKLPWTSTPTSCFECKPEEWPLRLRQQRITKTAGYAKCG
jgi:hypothetical protein